MKYQVQNPGVVLDLIAPYDVNVANADLGFAPGFKVGSIIAVAVTNAANGTPIEGVVEGCFKVSKATGTAWTQGLLIYWDDTAKNFTTVSTSNTKAGYATVAALSGDTVGVLSLVPSI